MELHPVTVCEQLLFKNRTSLPSGSPAEHRIVVAEHRNLEEEEGRKEEKRQKNHPHAEKPR